MNKRAAALLLAGAMLFLAGCGSPFAQDYTYSEPFSGAISRGGSDATEIGNYNMLKGALVDLVNRHEESAAFRFSRYNGSVADDLAAACLEVRTMNPLGAYAVETLTYDTSRIVSYYTAEVQVTYKKTAEEIRNIRGISAASELEELLLDAVTASEEEAVLRIFSAQVDEDYIAALIERLYFNDPVSVVTEPEAEIDSFPAEGPNRIYDVHLRYGAPAPRLTAMSLQLSARVRELTGGIAAETEAQPVRALRGAEALYALLTAKSGSFPGTAYGALLEGNADSEGTALAYKALCDALGIECLVVQGSVGGMGAEEHYWNILGLEGAYYHVDVSAFGGGRAGAFLLDDESLWGAYLWDAEAYPACAGALRYSDVAPEEAAAAMAGAEEEPQPETGSGAETEDPADPTAEPR